MRRSNCSIRSGGDVTAELGRILGGEHQDGYVIIGERAGRAAVRA